MLTQYTRQYKDDKKNWFDLRPIQEIGEEYIVVTRDEKIANWTIGVLDGDTVQLDGFVVFPHDRSGLFYVSKEEAENYIHPVIR